MKCPSGKIQYDSDSQALAYAKAYNVGKYAHRQRGMKAYLCGECEFWHLSKKRSAKTTRRRKAQARRAKARAALALAVWEGEGGA